MNIFLDSNAYLDPLEKDLDISSFIELRKLLKEPNSSHTLLVTEQVLNEYERNIGRAIDTAKTKNLIRIRADFKFQHSKLSSEVDKSHGKTIKKIKKDLAQKQKKEELDFDKKVIKIEKEIKALFKIAKKISYSNNILELAKERHIKGNPPKKGYGSYGDAINWESLISLPIQDDLTLITNDKDFYEIYRDEKKVPQRFLEKEWQERTGKKVTISPSLGSIINKIEKKKVISDKTITEEMKNPPRQNAGIFVPANITYNTPDLSGLAWDPSVISDGSGLFRSANTGYFVPIEDEGYSIFSPENYLSTSARLGDATYKHINLGEPTSSIFDSANIQPYGEEFMKYMKGARYDATSGKFINEDEENEESSKD